MLCNHIQRHNCKLHHEPHSLWGPSYPYNQAQLVAGKYIGAIKQTSCLFIIYPSAAMCSMPLHPQCARGDTAAIIHTDTMSLCNYLEELTQGEVNLNLLECSAFL